MRYTGGSRAWATLAFALALAGLAERGAGAPTKRGAGAHAERDQATSAPTPRPFSVVARRYKFEPARIEVFQDDLVRIDLKTEDIAHSWTVDEYRIAKRAGPGHPVSFEFRADKVGTFPFYCSLQTEDGCRQMRGELVVKRR